jgi:hypothetical protein
MTNNIHEKLLDLDWQIGVHPKKEYNANKNDKCRAKKRSRWQTPKEKTF